MNKPTRFSIRHQCQLKLFPTAARATQAGPFLTVAILNDDQLAVA